MTMFNFWPPNRCPNCGACPSCGHQLGPHYPPYPSYPFWMQPNQIWSVGTQTSSGNITFTDTSSTT